MLIVATIGAATALMAATIGLVQNDIKRVLAYSTVSQLGYMFLAMGVGAFTGGIFHLYTHAFFKALMFLGSGAVIHALHGEQDMRNMGGLKKHLPITFWTFLMGTIAIAGVPPLAGFFSKDEILWKTFARRPHRAVGRGDDHRAPHGDLHVPPALHDVLWRAEVGSRDAGMAAAMGTAMTPDMVTAGTHMAPICTTRRRRWPSSLVILAIGAVLAGLRRRAACARRQQPHRGLPRAELPPGQGRCHDVPRRRRPRQHTCRRRGRARGPGR